MKIDGKCHTCHRDTNTKLAKAPSRCDTCHVDMKNYKPNDHLKGWKTQHSVVAKVNYKDCKNCHSDWYCQDCHTKQNLVEFKRHPSNFKLRHSIEAMVDPASCGSCHRAYLCGLSQKRLMEGDVAKILYPIIFLVTILFIISCGSSGGDHPSPTYSDNNFVAPQLVSPASHAGGIGWNKSNCIQCHTADKIKAIHSFNPNLYESFKSIGFDHIGACLYCHNTNGLSVSDESYECILCHTDRFATKSPLDLNKKNIHDVNGDKKFTDSDCLICHKSSDMNGKFNPAVDFNFQMNFTSTTELCLNCHSPSGYSGIVPPPLKYESVISTIYETFKGVGGNLDMADVHGYGIGVGQRFAVFRGSYTNGMIVDCISCHTPHASKNSYLIVENGQSAILTDFAAKQASVTVNDNNFSELCAVCHKSNKDNAPLLSNGLEEVVHDSPYSDNCTDCHFHGAGFSDKKDGLF